MEVSIAFLSHWGAPKTSYLFFGTQQPSQRFSHHLYLPLLAELGQGFGQDLDLGGFADKGIAHHLAGNEEVSVGKHGIKKWIEQWIFRYSLNFTQFFWPSEFLGFFGRFFGNLTPSEGIFGWRTGWASELHSDVRVGLAPSVLMSK